SASAATHGSTAVSAGGAISGVVTNPGGNAVPGAHVVVALVDSSLPATRSTVVDTVVTNPRVATVTTSVAGRYVVGLSGNDARLLTAAKANHGYVNLRVEAIAPGLMGLRFVVRHWNETSGSW